jgi:Ca2+-transporting ATPase
MVTGGWMELHLPRWVPSPTLTRVWGVLGFAWKRFLRIDAPQWAAAFGFNAFFSLFPMVILFVALASFFVDRHSAASAIIAFVEGYLPLGADLRRHTFETIAGAVEAREQASAVALFFLLWTALQSFTTLVLVTNHAWGTEQLDWWRLPLRSLLLLGVTAGMVLLGMAAPVLVRAARASLSWAADADGAGGSAAVEIAVSLLFQFGGLCLFYRLAPRRPTRLAEVWVGALCATVLLKATESLFVIYLRSFSTLNAIYGAFGGIMALLLWIYVSGCIFIFGACLSAAQVGAPARRPATGLRHEG